MCGEEVHIGRGLTGIGIGWHIDRHTGTGTLVLTDTIDTGGADTVQININWLA